MKDEDTPMKCNVERILWFNVDCPTRFEKFQTQSGIRKAFKDYKAGKYEEADDE